MDLDDIGVKQQKICARYGVEAVASPCDLKVGIARNVRDGAVPVNGLRHVPAGDTTGWFIWAGGEPSADPDFFEPLHVEHISEWCPSVVPYLQLPPGYRFQIAPGYEDVWADPSLLEL